ncbi:MAG TPA: ATP-binding protein, partial [Planctomycetota bacterium]|nr:ATP-binding protein [Planctomycetota bacterium]
ILVNPAAAAMLGWSTALSLPVEPAFADPVFAATFAELSRRAWSGEAQRSVEVSLAEGTCRRVLSASLVAGQTDAQEAMLLVFFEDITARRELERQLAQVQKMDAIGKLAGGVAHDFNNLLTVINGRSHRILSKLQPENPLWREADIIHQTGERAAKLVRQLLSFSRKQVGPAQAMDLSATIADMDKMLHSLTGEGVELTFALARDLRPVLANPAQIEQVILNLVMNASEAMPQGGRLSIRTENVGFTAQQVRGRIDAHTGHYVRLSVSDSGEGMDEATQARAFEPFFTTRPQGNGMGLATVYGIVTQADGFITIDSAPGKGATFQVHLPVAKDQVTPALKEIPVGGGTEVILVVEDEDDVRSLVVQVLEVQGYQVHAAHNWIEAFGLAKKLDGRIDLLLTDVVMPQMSGREIAASLQPLCGQMKVLYMSGYTDSAIVHHGVLEAGINFLQKPFNPDGLVRAIRNVLDS